MLEAIQTGTTPVMMYPMEYRAILDAGAATPDHEEAVARAPHEQDLRARVAELEREIEQRTRNFETGIQAAREEARDAGRARERSEQSARAAAAYEALAASLGEFAAARDEYLAQVEREVVRLALAIAARVLHREALMDPLLLAGAVRVALGQLAETTEVRLKVPAAECVMWGEMLRLMPNLPLHPEVLADPALNAGECLLETGIGNIDLGVKSQLEEIERGFFDLLEQRGQQGSGRQSSAFSDQHSEKSEGSESGAQSSEEQCSALIAQGSDRFEKSEER